MTYHAFAKVNIFLKIVGKRGHYHELQSRFMRVENLYDVLVLTPKKTEEPFELHGEFGCALQQNTIYKAYVALQEAGFKAALTALFDRYSLTVEKHIPSFAGLGGGSSDAASFLHLVNDMAALNLDHDTLAQIGIKVGADVPFFVYNYHSANVSGIGEIVEPFEEPPLKLDVFTPNIKCNTAEIYKAFREHYKIDLELSDKMSHMKSKTLLETYQDYELNDLLSPAIKVNKQIEDYRKKDWFFSGSGSSFFSMKETDKNG
ncbi:4-(cytidine 5'-diphospho)-2-C-methyl-D-erythritol kinase [Sulfurospirillum sp. 1612]|uniref:4-(cytidine 5'-diphospho)-2-C-methyl-D-erythritol kinase n=1 Tax=Sulfurospirillum sp. 1612 TaxID=3094835 RepID=UPI002F9247EB